MTDCTAEQLDRQALIPPRTFTARLLTYSLQADNDAGQPEIAAGQTTPESALYQLVTGCSCRGGDGCTLRHTPRPAGLHP